MRKGVWTRKGGEGGSWSIIKIKLQGWNMLNTTLLLGIML